MSPYAALRPCGWPKCPALVRKQYCETHAPLSPSKFADKARGTAASRGYGAAWKRVRDQVLREEPLCTLCKDEGRVEPSSECDHVVSRAAGGTDDRSNLRGLCQRHHRAKTAREAAAFRDGRYRQ